MDYPHSILCLSLAHTRPAEREQFALQQFCPLSFYRLC